MKTLIVYATQHGCTHKCAQLLKEKLKGDTTLWNLKNGNSPDFNSYDQIIIGGSIHVGKIQSRIQKLLANQGLVLQHKPFGLFLCCMHEGDVAKEQFDNAYPETLRTMAIAQGIFGGEFDFSKMNMLERFVTRKVAKVESSYSLLKTDEIEKFANIFNKNGHPIR